ncbi:hypothetical protein MRB53_009403 [Persea americana]|uniref:Uncharacterized protein n=1 Tax=Persea americana TaxID=3435 RepID=A0ACC2LQ24_PERAE|nr:hypothetical protein MRB53_009403 [Persea americana]
MQRSSMAHFLKKSTSSFPSPKPLFHPFSSIPTQEDLITFPAVTPTCSPFSSCTDSSPGVQKSNSGLRNQRGPVVISPSRHTQEKSTVSLEPSFGFSSFHSDSSPVIQKHTSHHKNQQTPIVISPNNHTLEEEEENSMPSTFSRDKSEFFYGINNSPNHNSSRRQNHTEYAADVEKIYRILRKFHSRAPKLELALQESGVPISSALVERVLNRCGDAGNLGFRFFCWASKQPGYRHSYDVYKTMIKMLGKMRQFGVVWALIDEMQREYPELITADIFVILMRRFASTRMVKKAIAVLDRMPEYGCEPDEHVFGCLLDALSKNGSVKEAALLFEDMRVRFPPNLKYFTSLLYAHEKKDQLEECLELVGQMSDAGCAPDLSIYNTVIRLACKLGEVKEAVSAWNDMEASGLSPGLDTFTVMIHGFLSQGSLIEACRYFKEMVERGLLSAPQYGTLKEILNPLLRAEKLEMAKEVWGSIVNKGCQLNVFAWTIWIHALFSNGHVKEACSYCLDMLDSGLMPQADTFAKLMRGLKKLYNRQIAAEITEKVRQMAADRGMTFKAYKRRGVRDEKEKRKAQEKRKRRGRRRRWGQPSHADVF